MKIPSDSLRRHRAFLKRGETDRPLLGCVLGFYMDDLFPRVAGAIPSGLVKPEDIPVDLFLEDCEQLYKDHQEVGDDYPFTASAFPGIPWMEAIMGLPIRHSPPSFWAEPNVEDWESWHSQRPGLRNPWAEKLLEMVRALVRHSRGRYPVAPTLMRGPSDILAAMRGAAQLPLDLLDYPDLMARAIELCADVWVEVGQAQLALVPECAEGYVSSGHGLRTWAPEKVIWLQEDAMALLSPGLYRQFFLPVDRRIAGQFPCAAFHLHGSAIWAIDELVKVPEIDVLELNLEAAYCDVEATFSGWKKIQAHKPLVIWRLYEEDFRPWLDRVLAELPSAGVSIQVTGADREQAKEAKAAFFEAVGRMQKRPDDPCCRD